jgi:hypothetical protein
MANMNLLVTDTRLAPDAAFFAPKDEGSDLYSRLQEPRLYIALRAAVLCHDLELTRAAGHARLTAESMVCSRSLSLANLSHRLTGVSFFICD